MCCRESLESGTGQGFGFFFRDHHVFVITMIQKAALNIILNWKWK